MHGTPRISRRALKTRRLFLGLGLLSLFYPLLRFIGFRLPKQPQLVEVAKKIAPGKQQQFPQFFLFARDDRVWAVTRKCTHLGCTLHYLEKEDVLECPCHQSRFAIDGHLINGPAKKPLKIYPVEQRQEPPFYIVTI